MIVSPADAFSIAWLIDRHGVAGFPQVPLSAPSLVTRHVDPAAHALSVNKTAADVSSAIDIHDGC
jgi:hypothetical protein